MSFAIPANAPKECARCQEFERCAAATRANYEAHRAKMQTTFEGKKVECEHLQKTVASLQADLKESEKRVEKRVEQFAGAGNVLTEIWKKNQEYLLQLRAAEKAAAGAKKQVARWKLIARRRKNALLESKKENAALSAEPKKLKRGSANQRSGGVNSSRRSAATLPSANATDADPEERPTMKKSAPKKETTEANKKVAQRKKEVSTDGAPPKPTTGAESGPNGAKIKELEVDDARSYQVQRVIGMRHKKRVRDFLIKWTGYEDLEWTPEKNCGQCKLAIKKFKNDMGWLILKPRTLDGEWLLPTDKWNFEEGERIPDEQMAGGSGLASEHSAGAEGSCRKRAATPQHVRSAYAKAPKLTPEQPNPLADAGGPSLHNGGASNKRNA